MLVRRQTAETAETVAAHQKEQICKSELDKALRNGNAGAIDPKKGMVLTPEGACRVCERNNGRGIYRFRRKQILSKKKLAHKNTIGDQTYAPIQPAMTATL